MSINKYVSTSICCHRLLKYITHIYLIYTKLWDYYIWSGDRHAILLVGGNITSDQQLDLTKRLKFYCPEMKLKVSSLNRALVSRSPILYFDDPITIPRWIKVMRKHIFEIDYRTNPVDGWEWIKLVGYYSSSKPNIEDSKLSFNYYVTNLKQKSLNKCYIFGTGPSLEKAINYDFSDGFRVVCNTIVKDPELWNHINPHFIVAGDAIYHFGHTIYANSFRKDLFKRMGETGTYFVYPDLFHSIVLREFECFKERLIPIPVGQYKYYHNDLSKNFALPCLGNVLQLLLLPLGCTLSKNVYLWGFDGRSPNDKLFWKNSEKHSYGSLIPDLIHAHPKFYECHIPKNEPNKYINSNFGDEMDKLLHSAESCGYQFIMMHKSLTTTLQKRCHIDYINNEVY